MRFCVLGAIEARHDGRVVAFGGGRATTVLAALLVKPNHAVSVSDLMGLLWPDSSPASARAQVHNLVSGLRRTLGGVAGLELIRTRPAGYELDLAGHELDLDEFRLLAERGRHAMREGSPALAAGSFAEALALWRGPALADVDGGTLVHVQNALHEERLAVAEAHLEARLALRQFSDVLRDVDALVVDNPYRERLHEIRMIVLAGSGRRADALAAYRTVYRQFVDELGVPPGPALRELHQRVLSGTAVVPPRFADLPAPRQLPPLTAALTGRDVLIREVAEALCAPVGGTAATALLVGPGGVGKTTVALAVAREAGGRFPDGQLFADMRGSRTEPVDPVAVAGRFLRALGVDGAMIPGDRDERIAMWRSHAASRRLIVVLDDVADEAQVRELLPGSPNSAVLVTSRRRLGGLLGTTHRTVPELTEACAVQLFAAVAGQARVDREPRIAAAIVGLCGRLPLAICVAAARLATNPSWSLSDLLDRLTEQRRRLSELAVGDLDVRAGIALSYQLLDEPARRLLRNLALADTPDWPEWMAAGLTGRPAGDAGVARALRELVDMHLVAALGADSLGQQRFRLHDLIADFARERGGEEDGSVERHEVVSRVLDGWYARTADADERLDHGMVVASGLARPRPDPVTTVSSPTAWFEIERANLVAAVHLARAHRLPGLAGGLALRLSGFLALRSYDEDRELVLSEALACARAGDDDPMLVRLLGALFAVRAQRDRYAELPAIAEEELAAARRIGDGLAVFIALTHAGRAARMLDRLSEAARLLEQAVSVVSDTRLPDGLAARALHTLSDVHAAMGRLDLALPLIEAAVAAEREAGGGRTMAIHLRDYGLLLTETGRLAEARLVLDEAMVSARQLDDDRGVAWVDQALAEHDMRLGDWSSARQRLTRSLSVQRRLGDREGEAQVLRSLGDLAACQERQATAIDLLRKSLRLWRELGARLEQARTLARLERMLAAAGDVDAARDAHDTWRATLTKLGLDDACLRTTPPAG